MAAAREIYGNGCTSVSGLRVQKGAGSSKSNPPDTRFTGKPRFASPVLCFFVLLLFLSLIDAWGACGTYTYSGSWDCNTDQVFKLTNTICANSVGSAGSCKWSSSKTGTIQIVGSASGYKSCLSAVSITNWCCTSAGVNIRYCDTQAEMDSVLCAQNPNLPQCITETDTTLFACSDLGNGKSGLYRLACKAQNGAVASCNGKTDVNVETDGTLIREQSGTCSQNGFENGIFGGSSPADTAQPQPETAECFAVLGSKCVMRDRNSGNTYQCDCDGSCDYAVRQLASGTGCANPYPQPQSSSAINLSSYNESQSSAAASSPSSAGSSATEGSSNSGGTSSEGEPRSSSDFEYDYTDVLNDIRANTQYTGTQLNTTNDYLRQIAGKDWNPTINVAAPIVNVDARDTININVQGGDTARAGRDIYDWLTSAVVLDSSHLVAARQSGDSLYNSAVSFSDSVATLDVVDYSDSIGDAVQGVHGALATLRDTLDDSAISDSLERWQGLITDNGVISGAGSNSCPAVLTRQIVFTFPLIGDVQGGTLGRYLCTPITGLSITLWALVRVLLRAGVAIACMWWLYRAVTGTETSGEDD